jgi:hypothetical protein
LVIWVSYVRKVELFRWNFMTRGLENTYRRSSRIQSTKNIDNSHNSEFLQTIWHSGFKQHDYLLKINPQKPYRLVVISLEPTITLESSFRNFNSVLNIAEINWNLNSSSSRLKILEFVELNQISYFHRLHINLLIIFLCFNKAEFANYIVIAWVFLLFNLKFIKIHTREIGPCNPLFLNDP